jgi:hypothetical protein
MDVMPLADALLIETLSSALVKVAGFESSTDFEPHVTISRQ